MDPITGFYDQLRTRLGLDKKWFGLEPFPPIQFARAKYKTFEAPDVVTAVDARTSTDPPAVIFERLKIWFDAAVPRHGRGVLLLVYAPVTPVNDQQIRSANWRTSGSAPVIAGWYDLSSSTHFLAAGDLEPEIFGSAG